MDKLVIKKMGKGNNCFQEMKHNWILHMIEDVQLIHVAEP